jgi:ankyrin repeat protein
MLAALAGHEEIAALLLERGADSCGKTVDGSTALMIAVSKGNQQIVSSLLKHTRTRLLALSLSLSFSMSRQAWSLLDSPR